jgi:phospholipid-transporting ATPase
MKNSIKQREKKSLLENQMNSYIILVFLFLLIFCFIGSAIYIIWINKQIDEIKYLDIKLENVMNDFMIRFGNWILIFGNFVPISLIVTLETVKFFQALNISKDKRMSKDGILCTIQSSNLNEELGQIDYIFSDKTGTLTQNKMIFKKIVIGSQVYPKNKQYINKKSGKEEKDFNVEFESEEFQQYCHSNSRMMKSLELLSLCHTITVHEGKYQAESPDELALV